MAKRGAIVRRLASVETLGCTSVICSDKTGTLTTNQMSVRRVLIPGGSATSHEEYEVQGSSYGPEGLVFQGGKPVPFGILSRNAGAKELLTVCALCNDSRIIFDEKTETFSKVGEPTEAALKSLVEKFGSADPALNARFPPIPDAAALAALPVADRRARTGVFDAALEARFNRVASLEFSRDRKSMSVLADRRDVFGGRALYVKGAPEQVISRCTSVRVGNAAVPLSDAARAKLLAKVEEWGGEEALRVLAFAVVDRPAITDASKVDPASYASHESNMTFVGLVGMLDPPRAEVRESIRKCREAGIRVIVITGDNKKTAESICRSIGVFHPSEGDLSAKSYTGREFDDLDDAGKLAA
ncbi:Sarcoplasmic/endoplasmic reticulum calcium ATPase 3, partial [Cladochytrium tenue]